MKSSLLIFMLCPALLAAAGTTVVPPGLPAFPRAVPRSVPRVDPVPVKPWVAADEEEAVNPPAISLEATTVSLAELCEKLTQATGVVIKEWPGGRANETFTLSVKDKPFWDVYAEISRQHPVVPRNSNGFSLAAQSWGMQDYVRSGGFVMYVESITRVREASLQLEPGKQLGVEQLTMRLTYAADPRVIVLRRSNPVFTEMVDDLGNSLVKAGVAGPVEMSGVTVGAAGVWGEAIELVAPVKLGRKIARARAEVRFVIQTAQETMTLDDPAARVGEKIEVGPRMFTLSQFAPAAGAMRLRVTVADRPGVTPLPELVTFSLVDGKGVVVWSARSRGVISMSGALAYEGALKLRVTAISKVKEVVVGFELKDVALPR